MAGACQKLKHWGVKGVCDKSTSTEICVSDESFNNFTECCYRAFHYRVTPLETDYFNIKKIFDGQFQEK